MMAIKLMIVILNKKTDNKHKNIYRIRTNIKSRYRKQVYLE